MGHLTEENRKMISSGIAHKRTCASIAQDIGCDPTTVSKEVKTNRVISKSAKGDKKILCKKLDRFPYVCADCPKKSSIDCHDQNALLKSIKLLLSSLYVH